MGIFNNVMSNAMSSGVTRNSDTTWNRKTFDSARVDKRKELQAKARTNFAKAVESDYSKEKQGLDLLF